MMDDDDKYLIQEKVGDYAILEFDAPEISDNESSVILHSKGYYLILREQEGKVQKKILRTFKNKGRFPEYSKELYREFLNRERR